MSHHTYRGVMHDPLKPLHPLHLRDILLRRQPHPQYKPPTRRPRPIRTIHRPPIRPLIEPRPVHPLRIVRVLRELQTRVDVVEVPTQLVAIGVALVEREILPDLLVEELVEGRVAVDPCAGVAVPVPYAAGAGAGFEDPA